jgi:hypothetical protein
MQRRTLIIWAIAFLLAFSGVFGSADSFTGLSGRIVGTLLHLSQTSEGQVFPTVKAFQNYVDGYANWPWSKRYRDFADDKWVMPFEIYSVKSPSDGGYPGYIRDPVYVDMNGDGLVDVLYSYYNLPASGYGTWRQYLLYNTGSGFEVAWKCVMEGGLNSKFYGDCADVATLNNNSIPSVPAFGVQDFFYSRASEWIQRPRGLASGSTHFLSGSDSIYDWGPQYSCGSGTNTWCYGRLAKLMDVNGDGLLDVVLKAQLDDKTSWDSNNMKRNISLMLYNTGMGFKPARACYELRGFNPWSTTPTMQGLPETTYCY